MKLPTSIMAVVELPWPNTKLRPNARIHFMQRSKLVKMARQAAHLLALEAGMKGLGWDGAHVRITFHEPDKRQRDLDGMLSQCKAYFDGIADATGIDDSRWTLQLERGETTPGGSVVVRLSPIGKEVA